MIYFVMLVVILEVGQADPSKLPITISPSLMEYIESTSATICNSKEVIDQEI